MNQTDTQDQFKAKMLPVAQAIGTQLANQGLDVEVTIEVSPRDWPGIEGTFYTYTPGGIVRFKLKAGPYP